MASVVVSLVAGATVREQANTLLVLDTDALYEQVQSGWPANPPLIHIDPEKCDFLHSVSLA